MLLNIYCFRFNIFKKAHLQGFSKKRAHFQKTLKRQTPSPDLPVLAPEGLKMEFLEKIVKRFRDMSYFCNKVYIKFLIGFEN